MQARRGRGGGPELLVSKTVNSAFYGSPDLDAWFKKAGIAQFVVAGIQTNMCAETTARMGGNLGYEVLFPREATHTFDLTGPFGWRRSAEELARAAAVSLHGGRFADVVTTAELLAAALGGGSRRGVFRGRRRDRGFGGPDVPSGGRRRGPDGVARGGRCGGRCPR